MDDVTLMDLLLYESEQEERAAEEDPSLGPMFSPDRAYRWWLRRQWDVFNPRRMVFIGLNPSTATAKEDDPTIRRWAGFAQREGCGSMLVLNLFALRATDPRAMLVHPDPVGERNDIVLVAGAMESPDRVVACWGAHGGHLGRDRQVWEILTGAPLWCLGTTRDGHPRHPLYLPAKEPLVPWAPRRIDG